DLLEVALGELDEGATVGVGSRVAEPDGRHSLAVRVGQGASPTVHAGVASLFEDGTRRIHITTAVTLGEQVLEVVGVVGREDGVLTERRLDVTVATGPGVGAL